MAKPRSEWLLIYLLTLCACAIIICDTGGTLENPIEDSALCEQLIPPGMEGEGHKQSSNVYLIAFTWLVKIPLLLVIVMGSTHYRVQGLIMQAKVDGQIAGMFVSAGSCGHTLNCPHQESVSNRCDICKLTVELHFYSTLKFIFHINKVVHNFK